MSLLKQREIEDASHWIESIFRRSWLAHKVNDLITDFSNGVIIIHLVQVLAQKELPILFSQPKNFAERIGNIEMALEAFHHYGFQTPGILASDIASGDHEIIVAFCNMMKHHYTKRESLSFFHETLTTDNLKSDEPDEIPIQRHADGFLVDKSPIPHSQKAHIDFVPYEKEDIAVFEWVSSQIGTEIGDYNAFKDGIIMCKLINKVSVSKIPEKVIANTSNSERIKLALEFAAHELGIEVRLGSGDVIRGENRIAMREYVSLLRGIRRKQESFLVHHMKNCKEYSDLLDCIHFTDASKAFSPLTLNKAVDLDLCANVYRSAVYEKLAQDYEACGVPNSKQKIGKF